MRSIPGIRAILVIALAALLIPTVASARPTFEISEEPMVSGPLQGLFFSAEEDGQVLTGVDAVDLCAGTSDKTVTLHKVERDGGAFYRQRAGTRVDLFLYEFVDFDQLCSELPAPIATGSGLWRHDQRVVDDGDFSLNVRETVHGVMCDAQQNRLRVSSGSTFQVADGPPVENAWINLRPRRSAACDGPAGS